MVAAMVYRDPEVDPDRHVPGAASVPAPPDWRRRYEQARERAEAAEARVEELKWAEVAARTEAGAWKSQFETARRKRLAAVEDANKARRAAKNALALATEVRRLNNLLAAAGVASDRYSVMGLRREIARLRSEVPRAEVQARKIRKLYKALWKEQGDNAALRRIAAWLGDQRLPVAAGTLADSVPRFVPLFEPLGEAILAHQNAAVLRHADETTWRVQALRAQGRSARAWLWTSVGDDAVHFHIDPSRSAEAARTLFGEMRSGTVIVCDRYSAYQRLARLLGGMVTLQFCWAHMRRDFIQCAAGQVDLAGWCKTWLERIAALYRLNEARLARYDPGAGRQGAAFDAAHDALTTALDGLFAAAERELAGLPRHAREGKALRSLVNHREGLSVFAERPRVPLDNNLAERVLRGPAIARRLSFGSDSGTGARFTALMYSVVGTLTLNRIDVRRWLEAWLAACADNAARAPDDLSPWLPWSMEVARRRELTAPR